MEQLLSQKDITVLRSLGIGLVVVFGSHITGGRHPGSDTDVGVVFQDLSAKRADPVEIYGSLHNMFSHLFPDATIDIVYLQEAPLSLQFRAVQDGELVFLVSPSFAADYKERVMKLYFDFAPVEREAKQALFGSV